MFWHSTQSDGGWASLSGPALVIHLKLLICMYMVMGLCVWLLSYTLLFASLCVCVWAGELYLFCKGADSSIFPRVVSGKVDQVRARVEHNAVVRAHTHHLFLLEHYSHDSPCESLCDFSSFHSYSTWPQWFPRLPREVDQWSMAHFHQTAVLYLSIEGPVWPRSYQL